MVGHCSSGALEKRLGALDENEPTPADQDRLELAFVDQFVGSAARRTIRFAEFLDLQRALFGELERGVA